MKKLINDPLLVVREMLEGTVDLYPHLALLQDENVVVLRNVARPEQRPVAIISGGGAGHEPAHAGYVGEGMLSAAVVGDVFTSPSTDAVLKAIRAVAGPAGAVLVVKNYTGDRLNFGLAAELARQDGIPTEVVVVGDDVALRDLVPKERRRGIAGTVLVHKLAGAAAKAGEPLASVVDIARRAAGDIGSMGVGLGTCTVPTAGKPGFTLGNDEIELGLGIHGEKGIERVSIAPADEIVDKILTALLGEMDLASGARVALLVNGLGATTGMELAIVARRTLANMRMRGYSVERAWSGNYMTALEMPGCSISLLPLDNERDHLLDAPTNAPAWTSNGHIPASRTLVDGDTIQPEADILPPGALSEPMLSFLGTVAVALRAAEDYLTDLDSQAGDGDLGASMARGAQAIDALPPSAYASPHTLLVSLGNSLRKSIAGSSGPFYATALIRAGAMLKDVDVPTQSEWLQAFNAAVASIGELGGAKPGDRTMLDALHPALSAWEHAIAGGATGKEALRAAADAAETGASATARMAPLLGRASYLGNRALGIPDGGAVAVSIWLKALSKAMDEK